jgi:putative acetyltransferase
MICDGCRAEESPLSPSRFTLRPIEPRDDAAVASIIRTVMPEFGASGPGFAIHDAEVDTMCAVYRKSRSAYFVVEVDGVVVGGGGIAPLEGGDGSTCELRKMYFLPAARGLGAGRALLECCLHAARGFGFKRCYLETLNSMTQARRLYEAAGFQRLQGACGATGHFSCDAWYDKPL